MSSDKKEKLNIVVVGHVDSGKSTTCGQLMVSLNNISQRKIDQFKKESAEMGKGSFMLAWCMDNLKAERERGITINSSLSHFSTQTRNVTIIDAPGHRDFIKNMITGASQADAAVLIVSAAKGEFESGVSASGQTREHALLIQTLGIRSVIIAVNKMDTLQYSQERFKEIKNYMHEFLTKLGYKDDSMTFIPVSGFHGDNIVKKSENIKWYSSVTLVAAIDSVKIPKRPIKKALRLPVAGKYKISGVGLVLHGRVETGVIKTGILAAIEPGAFVSEIKSVQEDRDPVNEGTPGMNVGVNVKNIPYASILRGMVLGDSKNNPPRPVVSFVAKVIIINTPNQIKVNYSPVLHVHSLTVTSKLSEMKNSFCRRTNKVLEENPQFLKKDQGAVVTFVPVKPIVVEPFKAFAPLGRFSIRDSNMTVGCGIVVSVQHAEVPGSKKK